MPGSGQGLAAVPVGGRPVRVCHGGGEGGGQVLRAVGVTTPGSRGTLRLATDSQPRQRARLMTAASGVTAAVCRVDILG
jgi:hypothetical protein